MMIATLPPPSRVEPRYSGYGASLSVEEAAAFLKMPPQEVMHLLRLGVLSGQEGDADHGVSLTSLRYYRQMCEREQRSGLTRFFDQLRQEGLYDTED